MYIYNAFLCHQPVRLMFLAIDKHIYIYTYIYT